MIHGTKKELAMAQTERECQYLQRFKNILKQGQCVVKN